MFLLSPPEARPAAGPRDSEENRPGRQMNTVPPWLALGREELLAERCVSLGWGWEAQQRASGLGGGLAVSFV